MNEYELNRLEKLICDWARREYRSELARVSFLLGVLAVIGTQDGITSDDIKRLNTRYTYIIWHDGEVPE